MLFVSLEMARIELAERLLCCQSRVDSHKVRKGHLNSDDIQKLMDAGDVLRKARLYHRRHAEPQHDADRRHRPAAERSTRTTAG